MDLLQFKISHSKQKLKKIEASMEGELNEHFEGSAFVSFDKEHMMQNCVSRFEKSGWFYETFGYWYSQNEQLVLEVEGKPYN